jgi:hypothetical protein
MFFSTEIKSTRAGYAGSSPEIAASSINLLLESLGRMISRWARAFGLDWTAFYPGLKGLARFWTNYRRFTELNSAAGHPWKILPSYPCLHDFDSPSGVARGHYFHQDLYVAQKIFQKAPVKHVDCGSRIDGFVAHVASFRPIEVLDIRDLPQGIPNVVFHRCDLLKIPAQFHEYCDSLSCLHVLEHIGLGRYGDPIDIHGYAIALGNLATILKPGGTLFLSTPFGAQRVEYNAHRIFHLRTLCKLIEQFFDVVEFAMVDDNDEFHQKADLQSAVRSSNCFRFALAIFELRKRG